MKRPKRRLLFTPDDPIHFGRDFCFLCGVALGTNHNTDEHVFPKWIQQRYQLWNQKLTLLNRTTIPYRQVTIPCCSTCNNEHLGKVETEVQKACDAGVEAVRNLPPVTLFLWLGKIFYGLLYRGHLLSWNRSAAEEGPIVPAEVLEEFSLHHQFLQAARVPFEFIPRVPASLFVYQTMEPSDPKMGFDFWDHLPGMGISIRVGKVGLICCLQDGGALEYAFAQRYAEYQQLRLHHIQFAQVTSLVFYDLQRFNRTPKFMLVEGQDRVTVELNPLGGLMGGPLFDPVSVEDYAHVLAHCTRLPAEMIQPEPGKLVGWLRHESGALKQMLPDDLP